MKVKSTAMSKGFHEKLTQIAANWCVLPNELRALRDPPIPLPLALPLIFPLPSPIVPYPSPCGSRIPSPPSLHPSNQPVPPQLHRFCAPTTFPTILYRLRKKVIHSSSTVLHLSSRSPHSGTQSSGRSEDMASAREGSLPANTVFKARAITGQVSGVFGGRFWYYAKGGSLPQGGGGWVCGGRWGEMGGRTVILALWAVGLVARDVENGAFDGDEGGFGGVVACARARGAPFCQLWVSLARGVGGRVLGLMRRTVTFGEVFGCYWVVFGGVELDFLFGFEGLGFGLEFALLRGCGVGHGDGGVWSGVEWVRLGRARDGLCCCGGREMILGLLAQFGRWGARGGARGQ